MSIEGPYLSQLLLLTLLAIIGWFVRTRLNDIKESLQILTAGQAKSRERLIRIETKLDIYDPNGNTEA